MTQAQIQQTFRGMIGEWDTTVLPTATGGTYLGVDDYLLRGAEQANNDLEYFFKDTTLTVTGQETALPTDLIRIIFVTLDGGRLGPTTIDQLNSNHPGWHNEAAGKPLNWYAYSKIGLYPAPSADFLTAAPAVYSIRHTATPTMSSTPGFDLLATQHHLIPCYYAAVLWFTAHGMDGDFARAGMYLKLYQEAVKTVQPFYQERLLQRGPQ